MSIFSRLNLSSLSKKILPFICLVLILFPLFVLADDVVVNIEPPISREIAEAPPAVIIGKIIQWIMGIIGALAVLMIVYGGIQYMFSGGDERQVKQAKGILTWSIVGLLICVFAWFIVWAVLQATGAGT